MARVLVVLARWNRKKYMCSIFSEAEGTTWNLKSYKFITFDEKLNFEKKTYNIHKNTVTIE